MILGVIPARYASTRFPGKPLAVIQGKSMIQRVYEQVLQCTLIDKVLVATDDDRIAQQVLGFGGNVAMTRADHQSGTDRCAEVLAHEPQAEFIINIQGDEPFIHPEQIDLLCTTLQTQKAHKIATLVRKIVDSAALFNPNIVKAVISDFGQALYFSRQALPYCRGEMPENWLKKGLFYQHIGLYGYTREALLAIAKLPVSTLEKMEALEQLRWLENGYSIGVGISKHETIGIDTPEDLEKAEQWLLSNSQ